METIKKKNSETQHTKVFKHLKKHGSITSWCAIEKYGATRLSAIIYNLRKFGKYTKTFTIKSHFIVFTDRYGHKSNCAKYILVKTK